MHIIQLKSLDQIKTVHKMRMFFYLLFVCSLCFSQENDSLSFIKRKVMIEKMNDGYVDSLNLKGLSEKLLKTKGEPFTTTFYLIFLQVDTNKEYKLSERKKIDISISNWGCKELYVPEWLSREHRENDELFVEVFKKSKNGEFVLYENKLKGHIHEYTPSRKIISLKNMQSHTIYDVELDVLNKITETGEYKINICIDLSNFGYFKVLKSSSKIFNVVE